MRKTTLITAACAGLLMSAGVALAGSAESGQKAFSKNGCWQCHGFEGQGGAAGPKLAQTQLPMDALMSFVRMTNGPMPPYSRKVLSDSDLEDIYAYLQARPTPADYKTIPLLAK